MTNRTAGVQQRVRPDLYILTGKRQGKTLSLASISVYVGDEAVAIPYRVYQDELPVVDDSDAVITPDTARSFQPWLLRQRRPGHRRAPSTRASAPINSRRCRSSRCGNNTVNFTASWSRFSLGMRIPHQLQDGKQHLDSLQAL
ncbi:hypothetical protein, partial [Streptomyces sp. Ncost-T10-10d]|uniref:hypothetical protein n=1 Tax=Streptomyces sp. Ncost-T10-10d TaxID=1839774 RepID=UPI001C405E08